VGGRKCSRELKKCKCKEARLEFKDLEETPSTISAFDLSVFISRFGVGVDL